MALRERRGDVANLMRRSAAYALQSLRAMRGQPTERGRLLEKLLRELVRVETLAVEHAPREARRLGETPPVVALREVATHVAAMRPRFAFMLDGHALVTGRGGISATLSTLRHIVSDRGQHADRAYRAALHDLVHGIDVVRVLREVARFEELFALIRWCDDWLPARRTLVARVEAQLAWFARHQRMPPVPPAAEPTEDSRGSEADEPHRGL
jgi:hypothetical protein